MVLRNASRALPVLVAAVVLAGTLLFTAMQNARWQESARGEAVQRASTEAVALQRQLDRALNAPIALAAYVQLNGGRIDGFAEFTDRMRALVPSITNLQLAPDGVVQHIHPLEGNEAAIGHQLLVDRERTTEAFAAVESGKLTLAGPFDLVQGGTAMVGRQPIYLPDAGNVPGVDPDFWGFATVLIDLEDFFSASRVSELALDGYEYELASFNRDTDAFEPFRTSGPMEDPVRVEVAVANGTWQLSLGRPGGWGGEGWTVAQSLAAVALAALAGVAVWKFQRRDERLVTAVDQRTSALRDAVSALEDARDDAERASAAKTAFLANVSHELRTPMNAIIGFAELIELEGLRSDDQESLRQIRTAGNHLLGLINRVLDVTAIEAGHLATRAAPVEIGDLAERVADLLSPLACESGVTVRVAGTGGTAFADEGQLFQIISNLAANAVRFTPSGGEVEISTSEDGDGCVVTVSDTGVGIDAAHLDTIFEAFERGGAPSSIEGTGIGLAIVERLVRAMNGTVSVESTVGVGSTFTVSLPAVPAVPAVPAQPASPAPAMEAT